MSEPKTAFPLIAILRGVTPERIDAVSDCLVAAGFRHIEIPLNSPDPFTSIERLVKRHGDDCLCGAGTVLEVEQVERLEQIGAPLVVSPNIDADVVSTAARLGLIPIPGVATPSEAIRAVRSGAAALKLFPASSIGRDFIPAVVSVMPKALPIIAVGGVGPADMSAWLKGGASGFGLGGSLFKPDYTDDDVLKRAVAAVSAFEGAGGRLGMTT